MNIRAVLMLAFVIFLYAFTTDRNKHRKIAGSEVVFTADSAPFLRQEAVNKLLIENKTAPNPLQKDEVDLNRLEKAVNANPMVEKSEVSMSIDGVLKAVVKQKNPVARWFGEDSSFYLDDQGNEMPLSDEYTARVPIISGEISNIERTDLGKFLKFISDDDFLKKNVTSVRILSDGSLMLTTRDHDYAVDFGKTVNMERKFGNYKAFFQKAEQDSVLDRYKKINLRFTQQVVCTK